MMEYKVIGDSYKSINPENFNSWDEYESASFEFYQKQTELIVSMFPESGLYYIHYFDSAFRDEYYTATNDINDEIQCLAIKDGADFVQFENGHYGVVAMYGSENAFEIILPDEMESFAKKAVENADPDAILEFMNYR